MMSDLGLDIDRDPSALLLVDIQHADLGARVAAILDSVRLLA